MLRILMLLIAFVFVVIMLGIIATVVFGRSATAGNSKGDSMPQTVQRVAYIALIVLMFGICAGAFGAV